MRKLNVLNANREPVGLDTVIYTNKTIDEVVYVDSDGTEWTLRDIFETNNIVHVSYSSTTVSGMNFILNGDKHTLDGTTTVYVSKTLDGTARNSSRFYMGLLGDAATLPSLYLISPSGNVFINHTKTPSIITERDVTKFSYEIGVSTSYSGLTCYVCAIDLSIFEQEPSQENLDDWFLKYTLREEITKTTYTLREFFQENLLDNSFINDNTDGWEQSHATLTAENGEIKCVSDTTYMRLKQEIDITYGKYWISFYHRSAAAYSINLWVDTINAGLDGLVNSEVKLKYTTDVNIGKTGTGLEINIYNILTGQAVYFDDIIFINKKHFDENMTRERIESIIAKYKKVVYFESTTGKVFSQNAKTKFDVAYTNKTIDSVEYVGPSGKEYTLRDIFGDGSAAQFGGVNNLLPNGNNIDEDSNNIPDGYTVQDISNYNVTNGVFYAEYSTNGAKIVKSGIQFYEGHEYFYKTKLKPSTDNTGLFIYHSGGSFYKATGLTLNEWNDIYGIYEALSSDSSAQFQPIRTINTVVGNSYSKENYLYDVDLLFDNGDNPDFETFNLLLEKWIARKGLNQQLTYEDIFEKMNLFGQVDWRRKNLYGVNLNPDYSFYDPNKYTAAYQEEKLLYHSPEQVTPLTEFGVNGVLEVGKKYLRYLMWSEYNESTYTRFKDIGFETIYNNHSHSEVGLMLVEAVSLNLKISMSQVSPDVIWEFHMVWEDGKVFDERITEEQIDTLLAEYKILRDVVIEPEVYVVTEPGPGLGGRYKMKKVGDFVYGHEFDFEKISFSMNFGINYNAYEGYNLVRQLLKDNVGVIEYDWGKGSRYADVRLLAAPKTEKDTGNLLTNKWQFELLNPFYELKSLNPSSVDLITNKNTHELSVKPYIRINVTSTTPMIELENDDTSNIDQEIRFDFTGVSTPFEVIIDCENKKITFADGSNAYGYLNMNYNSFFELIYNTPYVLYPSGCTILEWTHKQWVID